jgi:hypothetical protein
MDELEGDTLEGETLEGDSLEGVTEVLDEDDEDDDDPMEFRLTRPAVEVITEPCESCSA